MALRPRVSRIVYWTPPQLLFIRSSRHLSLHSPGWPKRKTHFPLTKFMKFSLIFKRSQRSQEEQPEEGFTARAGEAQPAPRRRLIYVNKSANLWGFVFRIWCASCCRLEEDGEEEEPAQGVPNKNSKQWASWKDLALLWPGRNVRYPITFEVLSFIRSFLWYGKKAKGNGKAKANKHANKPSRVELNRVASCELRLPHRPFLWHPERGQFQKGILLYMCVYVSSIRSVSPSKQSQRVWSALVCMEVGLLRHYLQINAKRKVKVPNRTL